MDFVRSEILRKTISQEIQRVLDPITDAGLCRRVQVLVPGSPQVLIALDLQPALVGTNKTFNLPVAHPNAQIEFPMGNGQALFAACENGYALLTIIVEYYRPGTVARSVVPLAASAEAPAEKGKR